MKKNRVKSIYIMVFMLIVSSLSFQTVSAKTTDEYLKDIKELRDLLINEQLDGNVTEQELFENAMKAMAASYDKYTVFYNKEESVSFFNTVNNSYVGIGVSLEVQNGKAVVLEVFEGGAAYDAGIKAEDIITGVNGVLLESLADNAALSPVIEKIVGEVGTYVTVQFNRAGTAFEKKLERRLIVIKTVKSLTNKLKELGLSQTAQEKVAAYQLTSFADKSDEDLSVEIKKSIAAGASYLLLDMRNNGGGYLETVENICKEILPAGNIVTLKDKEGASTTTKSTLAKAPFTIVLLVNGSSASATEIFAAAVKDSSVGVIIGEKTYGKGVAQSIYQVGSDYYTKVTTQEFYSPKGSKINGVGVTPDVIIDIPSLITVEERLFIGDKKAEVKNVEDVLAFLGYFDETPDEKFTGVTFNAIKAFQKAVGLYAYGVGDFTTQNKLNSEYAKAIATNDLQFKSAIEWIEKDIAAKK